jgi:hypothetical protein
LLSDLSSSSMKAPWNLKKRSDSENNCHFRARISQTKSHKSS